MTWVATVLNDVNDVVEVITMERKKSLFERCQAKYSHCIGKLEDEEGNTIVWIFSKCDKTRKCIATNYEIQIREEANAPKHCEMKIEEAV